MAFCYAPIDKAVHIIGYWLGLELIGQYFAFNPITLTLNLGALAAWGLQHRKDTAKNRRNFFVMFTIWMIVSFVFAIMNWYAKASNEAAIAEACADDKDAGSKIPNDDCMASKRS